MKATDLNRALNYVDDAYLLEADTPDKEIKTMKTKKRTLRILIAAALIGLLSITAYAAELLPIREASLESVRYAADRADDKVKFTDDALKTILNVPRVFLPLVLKGCVDWAKENGVELVTEEHMKIINDKRAKEKQKKK